MRVLLPAAFLTLVALAGCGDSPGSADDEVFDDLDLEVTATTGLIRGVVVDDAIRPLANATVTLRQGGDRPELTATTPDTGVFAFDSLEPGTYFLFVARPGFLTAQQSAEVVAGVAEPAIVKVVLARDLSYVAPFYEQFIFEGFIECSTGAAAGGGYAYLSACSAEDPDGNQVFPNDRFSNSQVVSGYPDWVQSEMVWESTQSVSQSLALNIFYPDPDEADGNKDLTVEGVSPLINTMDNGTAKEYLEGLEFEEGGNLTLRHRIFTRATDGTGPALTVQQRFTIYTTVFYGYLPPTGWTLIDSGEVPPPPS